MDKPLRAIYDVVNKTTTVIQRGKWNRLSQLFNAERASIYRLSTRTGICVHLSGRYIHPADRGKIFVLVDIDSGEEFDCIVNSTLRYYTGVPLTDNESKYITCLRTERQHKASVSGRILTLKPKVSMRIRVRSMKIESSALSARLATAREISLLASRTRTRVNHAILSVGAKKPAGTIDLIGCSWFELRGHIEAQFRCGMSWSNYGKWHLDHIRPCTSFDLRDEFQLRECFHFTNMQPLWATTRESLSRGDTSIGNINKNNRYQPADRTVITSR